MSQDAKEIRLVVGEPDVVPLGSEAAIAIVPHRAVLEQQGAAGDGFDGLVTLVLRREPQGWRSIHEHYSVRPPPRPKTK